MILNEKNGEKVIKSEVYSLKNKIFINISEIKAKRQ